LIDLFSRRFHLEFDIIEYMIGLGKIYSCSGTFAKFGFQEKMNLKCVLLLATVSIFTATQITASQPQAGAAVGIYRRTPFKSLSDIFVVKRKIAESSEAFFEAGESGENEDPTHESNESPEIEAAEHRGDYRNHDESLEAAGTLVKREVEDADEVLDDDEDLDERGYEDDDEVLDEREGHDEHDDDDEHHTSKEAHDAHELAEKLKGHVEENETHH
jgi:hypothetical protein